VWRDSAQRDEVEQIAQATYLARDLINTPAEDLGPEQLADAARKMAGQCGATIEVLAGDALLERGYPAIHLVGRSSPRPPALIDLRWGDPEAPKLTLVGKGVCFDTGGLDIKTHDGMFEMKKDMGGAAVVLGLAQALMAAATPVRLRVLVPAVDNAISGLAMRPRDIVRTRAGKTVEIGFTDAEGRLVLCDALTEACAEQPDLVIDVATLTGSAKATLGSELQAIFSDDDELAQDLVRTGFEVGDPLWRLPIWRSYRRRIDTALADMSNVAKGLFADAIVATLFLSEFVPRTQRWAHLDIMGMNSLARPGRPEGGEATGLLTLYTYLRRRYGATTSGRSS
jgi:leucyl aminopeptidase